MSWPRPSSLPAVALPQGCGHAQRSGGCSASPPARAVAIAEGSLPSSPGACGARLPLGLAVAAAALQRGSSSCPVSPSVSSPPCAAHLPRAAREPAGSSDGGPLLGRGPFLAWGKCGDRPGRGPSLSFLLPFPRPGRLERPGAADLPPCRAKAAATCVPGAQALGAVAHCLLPRAVFLDFSPKWEACWAGEVLILPGPSPSLNRVAPRAVLARSLSLALSLSFCLFSRSNLLLFCLF